MKKQIPLLITFVVGMSMIVTSFIPHRPFNTLDSELSVFFNILAAFAMVLGAGNLLQIHLDKIGKQRKGWGFSAVTVIGFMGMLIIGLFKIGNPKGITGPLEESGSWFAGVYEWVFSPLQSTMFSLLAFFVASASYRAFRAKNPEATILLLAGFVVLLGQTLVGTAITNAIPGIVEMFFGGIIAYLAWGQYRGKKMIGAGLLALIGVPALLFGVYAFIANLTGTEVDIVAIPELLFWIMIKPQLAGQRAIMIGICLGVISMSLRIILGVERSHLGSEGD
jgi:hypothetical protein